MSSALETGTRGVRFQLAMHDMTSVASSDLRRAGSRCTRLRQAWAQRNTKGTKIRGVDSQVQSFRYKI
eukprot:scaffold596_cov236-Pinguiococcus_pyrenoidosus.AAC.31